MKETNERSEPSFRREPVDLSEPPHLRVPRYESAPPLDREQKQQSEPLHENRSAKLSDPVAAACSEPPLEREQKQQSEPKIVREPRHKSAQRDTRAPGQMRSAAETDELALAYRARWSNGALRLLLQRPPPLAEGELVTVSISRQRNPASHRHQFAWLREAWLNLPDELRNRPWAETPETLRKHALIATGFSNVYSVDCGTDAAARRVHAALLSAEAATHGYAVAQVRGPVCTVWTPRSQSMRAMGRAEFQRSKSAILEWIAALLNVTAADLEQSDSA